MFSERLSVVWPAQVAENHCICYVPAECNVIPLILNAAMPVGAVQRYLIITCDLPTPPGPLRNT